MSWTKDLPPAAVAALKSETAGEKVTWAGTPNPRCAFLHGCAVWAMGIPWTALTGGLFAVLVAAIFSGKTPVGGINGWQIGMMVVAVVFAGSFVLAGLTMMAVPFWAFAKARRTVFAITDRRILTIEYGRAIEAKTIPLDRIVRWTRTERQNGHGTLSLVIGLHKDSDGDVCEVTHGWFAVPRVREAERLIEAMRAQAAA